MRAAGNIAAVGGAGGGGEGLSFLPGFIEHNFATNDTQTYYLPIGSLFESLFIFDPGSGSLSPSRGGELREVTVRYAGADAGEIIIGLHIDENVVAAASVALSPASTVETVFDFAALAGRIIPASVPVALSYNAAVGSSGNIRVLAEYEWNP